VLGELPKSLDETYTRVLKEIDEANLDEVYRLLQCLVVSIRPLRVEELAEILAVDFDDAEGIPKLNPDWRWEDQERSLQAACSSLISIVDTGYSRVVQFSHFSVKEFLTSPRLCSSGDASRYHISLEPAHAILAQTCLGVLLRLDDGVDLDRIKYDFPLARYAAEHWVAHAQFENVSSRVRKGMEHFFDPDKPQFFAWLKLYDIDEYHYGNSGFPSFGRHRGVTPLYYATLCGFQDLVEHLTSKHPQHVNARGGCYGTPLGAASAGNHFQVAQLLCQRGADVGFRGAFDLTPLHFASTGGHPGLVQLLLSHGADANSESQDKGTPLHWTAWKGHSDIARILLEHDADPNVRDDHGWTPLSDASRSGDLDMVRLLLGHGVDVNPRDRDRRTPLHWASLSGNLEAARALLEHGADVEAEENQGKTAFQLASEYGHGEIRNLLSEHHAKHERKS
jgi:ankyrin repeat protein